MNNDEEAIARFLTQEASGRWERFLKSLGDHEFHARQTEKLRFDFERNAQVMLTGNPVEAREAAAWVAKHADEVALRWCAIRTLFTDWMLRENLDVPSSRAPDMTFESRDGALHRIK